MPDNSPWWKGTRGEWYVVFQFIFFGIIFAAPLLTASWSGWPAPWDLVGQVGGALLIAAGGLLAVWGLIGLGSNLAAVPHPKDDATMVESGAYRYVRHPIYSGIILGALGWGLFMNSWLTILLALLLFVFFDIKSRREEKALSAKFSAYAAYQQRVRKLLPYLY